MEEERLAAASAASKAMAMMRRLYKEKAEVQMGLRRFAAEIDHLRTLIAVEERDAEAEEEIFRSAGRTLQHSYLAHRRASSFRQRRGCTTLNSPEIPLHILHRPRNFV